MLESQRLRTPAPILPRRVPSGRRAVEQPNACGDGAARLTWTFWAALSAAGVSAGLLGVLMMDVLHTTQRLIADDGAPGRRLLVLCGAGVLTGLGWWAVRRWLRGGSDVDDALWAGTGEVAFGRTLASGALSEVAVGAGASLGQEAAPKLLGAAAGTVWARWARLDLHQRRLLVACAAGAGMGAVYNVPLGGALVTAELLYGSLALPVVLSALVCSSVATLTTFAFVENRPAYTGLPSVAASPGLVAWAVLVGPIFGLLGVMLVRAVGWVSHYQRRGSTALVATPLAFVTLGVFAIPFPTLLGNGRAIASLGFLATGRVALLTLAALIVLKPLLTLLCLWAGASGGLFTPVLSTGAALGLLTAQLCGSVIPGLPLAACAVVGAAALSGATMQAPLAASVLLIELTGSTQGVLFPVVLATTLATLVVRYVDGYSVFTARLPGRPVTDVPAQERQA